MSVHYTLMRDGFFGVHVFQFAAPVVPLRGDGLSVLCGHCGNIFPASRLQVRSESVHCRDDSSNPSFPPLCSRSKHP